MSIYELLKDVPLFNDFSEQEMQILVERDPPIKTYVKDDHLITEGETSTTLFLLVKGVCRITKQQDGATIQLSRLKPGEIFGEMSWVTGKPRQSNVVANEDVTVVEMD